MRILNDQDVRTVPASAVVSSAREALLRAGRGELAAPPRVRADLGSVGYVFTAGAIAGGSSGFRAYRAGQPAGDQLVAVWDQDGHLIGLVVGDELGARRTGALGAVAVDTLARSDADTLAVVGSGQQAWTQLWAIAAVRSLKRVRVYSPTRAHREEFAARARAELGLQASATNDAQSAVRVADIVVLATRSAEPVIEAGDIGAGTHITTVGPKFYDAHEAPEQLAAEAAVLTCDSPAQTHAYPQPFFVDPASLTALADVLLGRVPGRRNSDDVTMHCSVGLAGSELVLALRLINQS